MHETGTKMHVIHTAAPDFISDGAAGVESEGHSEEQAVRIMLSPILLFACIFISCVDDLLVD